MQTLLKSRWVKVGLALLVANEIRGLILAVPVMVAMWQAGGTMMALWLGFCCLAGIALSVLVPLWVANRIAARVKNSGP